jgi:hypothetical protein
MILRETKKKEAGQGHSVLVLKGISLTIKVGITAEDAEYRRGIFFLCGTLRPLRFTFSIWTGN